MYRRSCAYPSRSSLPLSFFLIICRLSLFLPVPSFLFYRPPKVSTSSPSFLRDSFFFVSRSPKARRVSRSLLNQTRITPLIPYASNPRVPSSLYDRRSLVKLTSVRQMLAPASPYPQLVLKSVLGVRSFPRCCRYPSSCPRCLVVLIVVARNAERRCLAWNVTTKRTGESCCEMESRNRFGAWHFAGMKYRVVRGCRNSRKLC